MTMDGPAASLRQDGRRHRFAAGCAASRRPSSSHRAAHAADPSKVIRHVFPAAETGFDPAGVQDLYSATIEQMVFETLLTYDYLARPSKLVPLDGGGAAGDHRRRQDVHGQDQEGHLLHRRSGVQGHASAS